MICRNTLELCWTLYWRDHIKATADVVNVSEDPLPQFHSAGLPGTVRSVCFIPVQCTLLY